METISELEKKMRRLEYLFGIMNSISFLSAVLAMCINRGIDISGKVVVTSLGASVCVFVSSILLMRWSAKRIEEDHATVQDRRR